MSSSVLTQFRAVFLGAPGAGKGTQAQNLVGDKQVLHVSTGDMLRQHIGEGSELGKKAAGYMEAGQLVPDDLIIAMVEQRLEAPDAKHSWILDGFPRTLPQADALQLTLSALGKNLDAVVSLQVETSALVERLTGRRACSECSRGFHVNFDPPAAEGVCDSCGGELSQRADDQEETIRNRMEVYHQQTAPLEDYYRQSGLLKVVDGMAPIDTVTQQILDILKAI